jgi:SAM-dependent methyltransferase
LDKKILDQQSQYWEKSFLSKPEMFGLEPSKAAVVALKNFKEQNIKKLIELGAGLGRDTIFFAKNSISVEALDYSPTAIKLINKKAKENKLSNSISTKIFDVRKKLPFKDASVEACFSHMLYCMALSNSDLNNLNNEILRILKPGGINIYTVRHIEDGDYKNGIHIGENLYKNDGFIVHFFSKEKIKDLSEGFDILDIESFDEGSFPRKLFRVIQKKKLFSR